MSALLSVVATPSQPHMTIATRINGEPLISATHNDDAIITMCAAAADFGRSWALGYALLDSRNRVTFLSQRHAHRWRIRQ